MTSYRTDQLTFALVIAISGVGLSASPGLAFSSEAQQMCTGDAMRLCSSDIPDVSRITACMVRKRSQLSAGCRAVMDREAAARRSRQVAADD
jgi:hypothetical protein